MRPPSELGQSLGQNRASKLGGTLPCFSRLPLLLFCWRCSSCPARDGNALSLRFALQVQAGEGRRGSGVQGPGSQDQVSDRQWDGDEEKGKECKEQGQGGAEVSSADGQHAAWRGEES